MANIKTIDPILDANLEYKTVILESGDSVQVRPYPATNYTSSGGVTQWTISVPSKNTFTDRLFWIDCEVQITWTGTGTQQFHNGYDALRSYPLARCMINPSINFQNAGITQRVQEVIGGLLWYHKGNRISTSPTYMDRFQRYADGVGTNRNPLGTFDNSIYETQRGAFMPNSSITLVGTTGATATYRIMEPFYMSPLEDEQDSNLGFTNLTQIAIEIPWTDLSNMVSHTDYSGQTLSSVSVIFTRSPNMWLRHVNPLNPSPRTYQYHHQQIISYPTTIGSLTPNQVVTVQANNIQLDRVPKLLYVWACVPPSAKTYRSTDTFAAISNIAIQYDNIPNQLSTASQQILYEISKENGCRMTWDEFAGLTLKNDDSGTLIGTTGSVFCARFGTNIISKASPSDVYPTNLQVQATIKNVNQVDTLNMNLYVVVVYDSKIIIGTDGLVKIENGIDHSLPSEYSSFHGIRKYQGAGFKSFMKNFWKGFKKGFTTVGKEALKIAPQVLPLLLAAGPNGGQAVAGQAVGGKQMSERDLLRALKK